LQDRAKQSTKLIKSRIIPRHWNQCN
jgi:hypothetical protein